MVLSKIANDSATKLANFAAL